MHSNALNPGSWWIISYVMHLAGPCSALRDLLAWIGPIT